MRITGKNVSRYQVTKTRSMALGRIRSANVKVNSMQQMLSKMGENYEIIVQENGRQNKI